MTDGARVLADYRKSDFQISEIDLTFELSDNATIVTNRMKVKRSLATTSRMVLDGEQLKLLSVMLNEQAIEEHSYQQNDHSLTIPITEDSFILTIVTEINPQENSALEGLYKSGGAFCTQCEAEGFRRISYYLDRPDVMAVFTTKVIADKNHYPYLLSNGNKIDSGELNDNRHFVTWHDPFPKPCYLFALVAGNFDVLTDTFTTVSNREVTLEIFVDQGNINKAQHAMDSLKKSMKWDEEVFGLEYDLDIYMIVAVDFFNMGAMENKGLNVFNSKYVLADQASATDTDYFNIEAVIGHEYFHNWTGNRVTCRDWFQLSLKEGLTVFRDQQFSGDMNSADVARIQNVSTLRSAQFAEDAGPMAHPIRPEKVLEMNNFYTMTVYEKGAEVIRMLHTLLGKENFRKGMDLYFSRFDGMAVTCDDFVDAMADASNIDLSQFKHWYSQSGTPILNVIESYDAEQQQLILNVEQVNLATQQQAIKKNLHIPIKVEIIVGEEKQSHLLELKQGQQTWTFDNIHSMPVIAFLSGFSAPVKVNFEQSDETLARLMHQASDAFNRWDAGQSLFTRYIRLMVEDADYILPLSLAENVKALLESKVEPAILAEQLILPTFDELVESYEQVEPINLLDAIDKLELFLGQQLTGHFHQLYQQSTSGAYSHSGEAVGQRSLKNVCLQYLSRIESFNHIAAEQYKQADNMTDTLAVLRLSAFYDLPFITDYMADFEQNWRDNTLVMDKWFSLQASHNVETIFEQLALLEQHPLFSLKNPNRARSLIWAFCLNNPRHFHCITGRGYEFLTKNIIALNTINPQVASRLITPLLQFKRFDDTRKKLMLNQLTNISNIDNLSKDLKEKLEAALGA